VGCSGFFEDLVGVSCGKLSQHGDADRSWRHTIALVFGGSGFFDDVGLGVGFGVEPSSHLLPMHVIMYVWRGTRACSSFAGACLCQYWVNSIDTVMRTAKETVRSDESRTENVRSCMVACCTILCKVD
jgi:hypothetical protein